MDDRLDQDCFLLVLFLSSYTHTKKNLLPLTDFCLWCHYLSVTSLKLLVERARSTMKSVKCRLIANANAKQYRSWNKKKIHE